MNTLDSALFLLSAAEAMGEALPRYVANAIKFGHGSHVVADAAALMGHTAYSLCCWCAESVQGKAMRLPAGGECNRCPYVGRDCLLIVPNA
jgi:hypothetical protein